MERMIALQEAAQRLGVSAYGLRRAARYGQIPGAQYIVPSTGGHRWLVPESGLALIEVRDGVAHYVLPQQRPERGEVVCGPRCDRCGILLERSGDDRHANDKPDAGRCWMCREDHREAERQ